MNSKDIVTVLWTGGWDSTYRIVELSMRDVIIQPIYIIDPDRRSLSYETRAINEITEILQHRAYTKAQFMPLTTIRLADIPENKEITEAYLLFKREAEMGVQHEWIARLALQYPMMELCIEKALGDHAPIRQSIMRHGKLIDTGDGYIIDQEHSSKELNLILGNLRLPIFEKTEKDMLEKIKEWGYEDVMAHIWFCHSPIGDKPCGLCNPCTTKMTSHMEFLLPEEAQKRNIRMSSMERKIEKILGKRIATISRKAYRKIYLRIIRLSIK